PAPSWLLAVALGALPFTAIYLWSELAPFAGHAMDRGQILGRDFINIWSSARLLLEGRLADVFVPARYTAALGRLWGPGLGGHSFSYPPSLFPLTVWAGPLDYRAALALWSLGCLALLALALRPAWRQPLLVLAALTSPAVACCLEAGQTGCLVSGLVFLGLRLADRRPWLAGALIGLAAVKPQLLLLVPVALLAAQRWRVIAGAAAGAIAAAALGALIAGPEAWRLYLSDTAPYQGQLLLHSTGFWKSMTPSPFVAALTAGAPLGLAAALQGLILAVCAGAVAWRFRALHAARRPIASLDILLLAAAVFVATPYSFNYDMPLLALALAAAAADGWRPGPVGGLGAALLWLAPILLPPVLLRPLGVTLPDEAWSHWPILAILCTLGVVGIWASIAIPGRRASHAVPAARTSP
ncbi:MAG TPA: glycosyltransferase family 87 protein, partial [Caulobacteraceae bacterium]|nr:glycosyltransferase family 87 protein [Caulobacteraceae bacterium]